MPRQLTILFSWFIIINRRVLFTIHFEKSKLVLFQSILRLLEANDAQTFSRMAKVSMILTVSLNEIDNLKFGGERKYLCSGIKYQVYMTYLKIFIIKVSISQQVRGLPNI